MKKRLPLSGLRVLDFTWVLAGPMVTRLLGSLGAEVIRIEATNHIDVMRRAGPYRDNILNINGAGYFNNCNTDKLSANINIKHPRGQELATKIASISDIVVENFVPGVLERLGLGYNALIRAKPDLIVLRMPGLGLDGPRAKWRLMGNFVQAAAGLDEITGFPDELPFGTGMSYPDASSSPYHALAALFAALQHRRVTGKGQLIELSQLEAAINFNGVSILDYSLNGTVQTRMGNRSSHWAPHGIYPCAGEDRWCALSVRSTKEWLNLVMTMGSPQWAIKRELRSGYYRLKHADELDKRISKWTRLHMAESVMEMLQVVDIPASVVQVPEDLLIRDPQLRHRDFYGTTEHPEAGRITHDGHPYIFSSISASPRKSSPCLGEHTIWALQELLGLKEDYVNDVILETSLE